MTLPDATGVTAPTPLLILTDVAFVVVHDKDADEPIAMLVGPAERVTVGVEFDCWFEVEPAPLPLPQPVFFLRAHGCSKLTNSKLRLSPCQSCDLFRGSLKLYTRPQDFSKGIGGASNGVMGLIFAVEWADQA